MSEFSYPQARRLDLTEDILGHQVSDPYRWLEDDTGAERAAWLSAQADLFASYRAELPGRDRLADQVRELLSTGYVGTPVWRGERCFFTRRDPGRSTACCAPALGDGPEQVLVDPMAIDPSGLTTLDAWQPDKEGRLLAYQLSEGGDEESLLRVIDVTTGSLVDGPIDRCRYSNVAWLPGGKAFYYTRRLPPEAVPDGESQYHRRVYLHQVGTPADEDVLIFGEGRDKTDYYGVSVSRDGRWLVISASRGTAPRNDLWIADLSESDPAAPDLRVIQEGLDAQTGVRAGRDGRLYVFTDLGAPRGRIAVTDPADPGPGHLAGPDRRGSRGGAARIRDPGRAPSWTARSCWPSGPGTRSARSPCTTWPRASGWARCRCPAWARAGGVSERPEGGHEAWFVYTDYTTSSVVLRFDARILGDHLGHGAGQRPGPGRDGAAGDVRVQGRDRGADARHQLGRRLPAGPRPAILYGYGGFDISLTPAYSPNVLAWVSAGGVYAIANLRGGSEEGEEWHRAGMLDRKQNVFDDFHAAAETLIGDGWTTPEQLAISGGSNGGLLVGAALTQRPELYAAVICSAPLLDMVRYERFGLGQTWNVEYGTASDPEQLGWLLAYSPYHHVVPGTAYPAVLFTVFTNDTRVDPVHAYKMCAALQHATSSGPGRPVLLRAEAQVGARGAGGEPDGGAVRGHAGVRRAVHRAQV